VVIELALMNVNELKSPFLLKYGMFYFNFDAELKI
jgi:hypothetical protein